MDDRRYELQDAEIEPVSDTISERSYLLRYSANANSESVTSLLYNTPLSHPEPINAIDVHEPENLGLELESYQSESHVASSSFPNQMNHPLQNSLNPQQTDTFLAGVYRYYVHGGFWGTLLSSIVPLLILHVMTFLTLMMFSFTNWSQLRQNANLWSALEFSWGRIGVVMWFLLASVVIITTLRVVALIREIPLLWSVRRFYLLELNLPLVDRIQWSEVTDRISQRYPDFTSEVIVSHIMRRDNYLILFFTQRVKGSIAEKTQLIQHYSVLFEWCLNRAVWDYLLDASVLNTIQSDGQTVTRNLNARLRWMAILSLLCLPFLLVLLLVYYFLAYFERIRSTPTILGARMFSRDAQYHFRNFNELPIYFNERLNFASKYLDKYYSLEPAVVPFVVLELLSFLIGSFIAVVVIVGLWNNDILLNTHISGYSLLSLISVCVVIYMALRTTIVGQRDRSGKNVRKRKVCIERVIMSLEHLKEDEQDRLGDYYRYRIVVFLQELWNLIRVPIMFFWTLPDISHRLIDFVHENTVYLDKIGYVCKFCPMNKPSDCQPATVRMEAEEEKLLRSIMDFQQTYNQSTV